MASKEKREREMYVVKANELIRKTRYDLTTQQQKIVLYAISKIKPDDDPTEWYTFNMFDMCKVCGISTEGGEEIKRLKNDFDKLINRQTCTFFNKTKMSISWLGDYKELDEEKGTVQLCFNPNLAPYLFALKSRYTQYMLGDILTFRSKYTIRLYELIKSHVIDRDLELTAEPQILPPFSVEELKQIFDTPGYKRYADFNNFVLSKAVTEINKKSENYHLEYETIKGKYNKVIDVVFTVTLPKIPQMREANRAIKEKFYTYKPKKKRAPADQGGGAASKEDGKT